MSEYMMAEPEASWFDITVAGKRFNIASRHGEGHIREVESLLNETFEEVNSRVEGQSLLNIALLTALNLADQLLSEKSAQFGQVEALSNRVENMVTLLQNAIEGQTSEL